MGRRKSSLFLVGLLKCIDAFMLNHGENLYGRDKVVVVNGLPLEPVKVKVDE